MSNVNPNFRIKTTKKPSRRRTRPGMDAEYLRKIRSLPSCLSGESSCEAHHLRISAERGVGMKATDKWALPLTTHEHQECHRVGGKLEVRWFSDRGIDCIGLATALWQNKHSQEAMLRVLIAHRSPGLVRT